MAKRLMIILSLILALFLLVGCGGSGSSNSEGSGEEGSSGEGTSDTVFTPGGGVGGTGSDSVAGSTTPSPVGTNLADHIDVIMNETQLTVANPTLPAGTGGPSMWSYYLIHERLLERNASGDYEPCLAKDWDTDDFITFTFYLRDDVYFHNGDHFTADDVVWTIEHGKATPTSPTHATWRRVDSTNVIDPYTIEIVLAQKYVDFHTSLAGSTNGILNQRAYSENPDDPSWAWIGTGPFMVTGFATNDYMTMERFDGYWGEPAPTRSVTFWTIPEMSTRIVMLQNKEAQVSFQLTPEDLDILDADPNYQVFPVMINEPVIIGFNNQGDAIMKDLNFRLAVAHALEQNDIATVALGRWATASWDGNFWGPDTDFRLEGLPLREYDVALAKEYLDKSVYAGETISMITTSPHNIRAAEIIQLQLEDVGIKVDVNTTDHAGLVDALLFNPESTQQMHLFSMAMSQVMANVLSSHTNQVNNRLNYADPFLYEITTKYNAATDAEERRAMAYELQEYFYETVPAIAAFWRVQAVTAVNGIGGMNLSSDQFAHNLKGIYWDLDQAPAHLRP